MHARIYKINDREVAIVFVFIEASNITLCLSGDLNNECAESSLLSLMNAHF